MSGIAIMTDSNCGIMPSDADAYGIYVLPMPVIIDGETYYEGINITLDEFYKKQSTGAVISTSQPSPGDVTAMWDMILASHDELVFIPMSSGLSNTCQTALILAEDEPYKGRVYVVNNHRISVTQAMSVLDAKALAGQGHTAGEIKEILEKESLDATIYIAVNTLEYLKKRGAHHSCCSRYRHSTSFKACTHHTGGQAGFLRKGARNEICFPHNAKCA